MSKTIGGIFGRNAYGPLHEFSLKVEECAQRLIPVIQAWMSGDRERLHEAAADVDRLEGEADVIKNEIRGSLSKSIFSSVQGAKIKDVVKAAENVADSARMVARLVEVRETPLPEDLGVGLVELAELAARSMGALSGALAGAQPAADGANPSELARALAAVDTLPPMQEKAVDAYEVMLKHLFRHEKELDPISVFFLMRIVELVAHMTRSAENAGEALRRLGAE
jgi:uncharacterized protein